MMLKIFYSVIAHDFNFYRWIIDKRLWITAIVLVTIIATRFRSHRSNFKRLLFFLFSPAKFVKECVEDSIRRNIEDNPSFKKCIESDENYRKGSIEESRKQFTKSTNELRNSIYKALVTVFLIFICSILSAFIMVNFITINEKQILSIQIISAFLILLALLGRLGWSIQTIDGKTIPEQINNFWFIFLNVIGVYLLFFTYFFSLFKK